MLVQPEKVVLVVGCEAERQTWSVKEEEEI
jgi:hypothetical protein